MQLLTVSCACTGSLSPIDGLSTSGNVPNQATRGRIELHSVSFAYPTRPNAKVSVQLRTRSMDGIGQNVMTACLGWCRCARTTRW